MTIESAGTLRDLAIKEFFERDTAKRNNLVTEAIELALGIPPGTQPRTNPYDYVNRMSNERSPVGDTIYLDGKPLIFLGVTQLGGTPDKVTGTFHYRMLIPRETA